MEHCLPFLYLKFTVEIRNEIVVAPSFTLVFETMLRPILTVT